MKMIFLKIQLKLPGDLLNNYFLSISKKNILQRRDNSDTVNQHIFSKTSISKEMELQESSLVKSWNLMCVLILISINII